VIVEPKDAFGSGGFPSNSGGFVAGGGGRYGAGSGSGYCGRKRWRHHSARGASPGVCKVQFGVRESVGNENSLLICNCFVVITIVKEKKEKEIHKICSITMRFFRFASVTYSFVDFIALIVMV
jgi:hypothetical protein